MTKASNKLRELEIPIKKRMRQLLRFTKPNPRTSRARRYQRE